MSAICTLGISGIRSYSCHKQEIIQFDKPVTLILGANGSGKTTIIECLRAATCGSLPPGTNSGRYFLTDPEVAKQSDVLGAIKLKFVAINGHPLLVIRTMHFRKRGEKFEFKKLEQMIKSKNPNTGKTVSINYNVNEIDKQIPELMGVSKAILENVIFCHQEDSLWPFKDNATLKTIFDELFETTNFTKTHENMKNLTKDKKKKLRDQKSHLDQTKILYEKLIVEVKRYQNLSKDYSNTMAKLTEQRGKKLQVEAAIQNENIEEKLRIATSNSQLLDYQVEQQRHVLHEIESVLGFNAESLLLTGNFSLEARKEEIELAAKDISQLQDEVKKKEILRHDTAKDIKELRDSLGLQDVSEEKTQVKGMLKQLMEILHGERSPMKYQKASAVLEAANGKMEEQASEIENLEKRISEVRSKKAEQAIMKRNQIEELREKIMDLESIIKSKKEKSNEDKVTNIEVDIARLQADLESIDQRLAKEQQELSHHANLLDKAFESLTDIGRLRKLYEDSKKYLDLKNLEQDLSSSLDKQDELIKQCGLEACTDLSLVKLEELINQARDEEEKSKEAIAIQEKKKIEIEFSINSKESKREELEKKIQNLQKEISKSLGKENFIAGHRIYDELKEEIKQLEVRTTMAKELRETLLLGLVNCSHESQTCFLCEGNFDGQKYAARKEYFEKCATHVPEHETKMQEELAQKTEKLQILKANKDCLKELDANRSELELIEKDIEKLYLELGRTASMFTKTRRDSHSAAKRTDQLKELQMIISDCDRLRNSIASVDKSFLEDYKDREEELLKASKMKFPDEQAIVTEMNYRKTMVKEFEICIGKAEEEKEHVLVQISNRIKELNNLQNNTRDSRPLSSVEEELEGLVKELNTIESTTSNTQEHLSSELASLEEKSTSLRQQRSRIEYLVTEAAVKLKKIRAVEGEEETASKQRTMTERDFNIKKLSILEQKLSDLDSSINQIKPQLATRQESLSSLQKSLELASVHKKLQQLIVDSEAEKENIMSLKKRYEKEKQARSLLSELNVAISKLEGIEMTQNVQLGTMYDSIYENRFYEEQYAKAMFDFECTRHLLADLEFYTDSLDKALVLYHQEQIEMINKTIAKLWQATYRNKDITKIEIKTEQIVEKMQTKGNFNYRVVFYGIDGVELEMKGRSSMGQKVLASIVIRISLAQAFGINCGVLTLDEPTTNLDKANIESLARFLCDLIDQQQETDSLQLVIITHDDEFIRQFRRYTDSYYFVSKNIEGVSRIEKREFEKAPM